MAGSSRRKSLAGRIFWVLFLFSLAVAVAATVAATALSFSVYERDAEQILLAQASSYAGLIEDKRSEDAMAASLAELPFVETRCTLIAADGTVVFDNYADPASTRRLWCATASSFVWPRRAPRWRRFSGG